MADVFVSYKKEDAGRVVRIVEGLRKEGFTVWWDHGIAPGSQWDQTIQRELNAARIVVAVWSELSIHAPWVKEEALTGKARGALVPVRIDDVNPPLGFGLIQFADLIDWGGDIDDKHWDFFIESVRATMEGRPVQGLEKPAKKRRLPFALIAGVLAFAVLLGAGVLATLGLSDVESVSVQRGQGEDATVSTVSRSSAPAQPSEAETAMWDKVSETRLKSDYQDFLRAFPQGYYARQVREQILPLCQTEERDAWQPFKTDNAVRGVSDTEDPAGNPISFDDEAKACASARRNMEYDADRFCKLVAGANEVRDYSLSVSPADCECTEIEATGHVWCLIDSVYACAYETKSVAYVEVCG